MRIVLREGKKNQIKRMCRELIGWHVEHIHRIRIGPISINIGGDDGDDNDILPEGCWRPLTQDEIDTIISSSS
jgi:16S rRNA U516 pseudouridylate synthase RsuA-like enzyme